MASRHLASVPDRPQRAVVYVRVSAVMGRGGDDFHSPELQIAAAKRAAAGLRVVETVEDIDVTGTHFSREGIDRIRTLVEAGQVDVVAIHDLSRLGRNVLESLAFIRWLKTRGVSVVSSVERIDDSPEGQLMLVNLLAIAEYRAGDIGRRWRQVIYRRAERGQHHGRPPTGYERDDQGRLQPHPVIGPAVTEAFLSYADGGFGREIRRQLRARTGLEINVQTLKNMLRNPTYLGIVRMHGPGPSGTVEIPDAHQPLVDAETWERVQRRLAADSKTPPRLLGPAYSVSGLGQCATCGGPTNVRRCGRAQMVRLYCRRKYDRLDECAGCGNPSLEEVEAALLDKIRQHIANLKVDTAARAAYTARTARAGADARMLEREVAQTRKAMARTTERWAREQLDDRTYEDTMASLRETEARLMADAAGQQQVAEAPLPERAVALAEEMIALWPDMDGGQRNRALRDVITGFTLAAASYYRQPAAERLEVQFRADTRLP